MELQAMLGNISLLFLLSWPSSRASSLAAEDTTDDLRAKRFAISAAAGANIIAGASFAGQSAAAIATSLSTAGYTVATVIQIENHTKWKLVNGQSWTKWGHIKGAPHSIRPGYKEALKTHKTKGTVVGSAGVVYYDLEGLNEHLAIVWHAPYNFNHLSNYLAIGLYNRNDFNGFDSFNKGYDRMRDGDPSTTAGVIQERLQGFSKIFGFFSSTSSSYTNTGVYPTWPWCSDLYYYSTNVCETNSPNVEVHATMGTSHHPVITIKVFARSSGNKAPESPLYPSIHSG